MRMQRRPQQGAEAVASPAVAISLAVAASLAAGLPAPSSYLIDIIPLARGATTDFLKFQVETVNAMRLKHSNRILATFIHSSTPWRTGLTPGIFFRQTSSTPGIFKTFNIQKAQISTRILPELRPILDSVSNTDRYESTKKAIIQHFEESQ